MLPSLATIRAVMPVSSATSRRATSGVASPGCGVPFGSTQKFSQARPTSTTSTRVVAPDVVGVRWNTTPPAEKVRTVRGFDMSPRGGLRRPPPPPPIPCSTIQSVPYDAVPTSCPNSQVKHPACVGRVALNGYDPPLLTVHSQNLEQILLGVQIIGVAFDKLAHDRDGMELKHFHN